jgi:hypothetical protein
MTPNQGRFAKGDFDAGERSSDLTKSSGARIWSCWHDEAPEHVEGEGLEEQTKACMQIYELMLCCKNIQL